MEIELTLSADRTNGGDCFDCVVIRLEEPVGDRDVVDSRTGAAVARDGDPALDDCFDS